MNTQKKIVLTLLLITTLPFLLILTELDLSLFSGNPDTFYRDFAGILGRICGLIGAVLLFWQFLLGNRFTSRVFGKDIIWNNTIHKKIGIYGVLLIFIHPYLIMYSYLEDLAWVITPDTTSQFGIFVGLGRIALIILYIIWISSALLRSKIAYRPWKFIHLLAYPIFFFVFVHGLKIGSTIQEYPFLMAFWFVALALSGTPLLIKLFSAFGLIQEKVIVSSKEILNDVTLFTVKFNGAYPQITPGQYMYVMLKIFGEAHPFSIMEFDEENKTISFGIKAIGKFSKKIQNLEIGDSIFLDGPYGSFTKEAQESTPTVYIAGGIGITPFIEPIKRFGDKNTFLFYSNFKLEYAVKREQLKDILGKNYTDFITDEEVDEPNVACKLIDADSISKILPNTLNSYNFFICGSPRFVEAMNSMLLEANVDKNKIYTEGFGL